MWAVSRILQEIRGERVKVGSGYYYIMRRGESRVLKPGGRFLPNSELTYSVLNEKSIFTGSYYDLFLPLMELYQSPRVLVIGLAGGVIPYQIHSIYGRRASIDVVEVDAGAVHLPERFLKIKSQPWRVIVDDGAGYVEKTKQKYDVIILDAYKGDAIPEIFTGAAFAKAAFSALSDHGILAINLISPSAIGQYTISLSGHFSVYACNERQSNCLILGSKHFDAAAIKAASSHFSKDEGARYLLKVYGDLEERRPLHVQG